MDSKVDSEICPLMVPEARGLCLLASDEKSSGFVMTLQDQVAEASERG